MGYEIKEIYSDYEGYGMEILNEEKEFNIEVGEKIEKIKIEKVIEKEGSVFIIFNKFEKIIIDKKKIKEKRKEDVRSLLLGLYNFIKKEILFFEKKNDIEFVNEKVVECLISDFLDFWGLVLFND